MTFPAPTSIPNVSTTAVGSQGRLLRINVAIELPPLLFIDYSFTSKFLFTNDFSCTNIYT